MTELKSIREANRKFSSAATAEKQHSVDSEQCVLGGIMLDNSTYQAVSSILNEHDFYGHDHKIIYRAIQSQADKGELFDIVTLADAIKSYGGLKESDTLQYLAVLANDTPSAATVTVHAKIVRKYSLERKAKLALANRDFAELSNICNEINNLSNGITAKGSLKMIGDLLKEPMTHDWLVKGWIERKQSCVLWGASESYKSLLAIEIACAIAKGLAWRGNRVKQGAVLYIAAEGGGIGIRKRFKAWQIANNVSLDDAPIIIREVSTILPEHTNQLIKEVKQLLKEYGLTLELVILDTLSRTMQGDENSQKDFGEYQHALDTIRDEFQCATMFLHHVGHGDKTRARGASAIRCNADVELSMENVGEVTSKLHACKIKDAGKSDDMFFKLTVVDLGYPDEDGEPTSSVVLRHLEDYTPASTASLGKHENSILKILEKEGTMLVGDLRKRFQDSLLAIDPSTPYNTLKVSWRRAYRILKERKAINESEDKTTASLPTAAEGVQGVQQGYMYPNVPSTERVQGVQQPLGCTHVPRTLYPIKEDTETEDKAINESSGRGTSGGTRGTKLNVYLGELPDFGTSDENYLNSMPEWRN